MQQFAEILPFVQKRLQQAGNWFGTRKQMEAILNDDQGKRMMQL